MRPNDDSRFELAYTPSDWIDEEDTLYDDIIPTQPRIIVPWPILDAQ